MTGKTWGVGAKKSMRDEKNKDVVGNNERVKRNREVHWNKKEGEKKSNYKGDRRKGFNFGVWAYLEFNAFQIWLP